MPSIVQFFHPGKEHGYDKKCSINGSFYKDWNVTVNRNGNPICHRRKFLLSEGSYIQNNKSQEGKLLFWGEWEPPSRVKELKKFVNCSTYGVNPNFLHFPFLPSSDQLVNYQEKYFQDSHFYQNTDPFVFGDNFIYAICMQKMKSFLKLENSSLEKGSLILFGSWANDRFVIDTVFVVKSKEKYSTLNDVMNMKLGIYPEIVTKFILNKNNKLHGSEVLTLYKGATADEPQNNMYSFVPAIEYVGEEIGFPRFFMPDDFYDSKYSKYLSKSKNINSRIIERKNQGIKIINTNQDEILEFWNYIKDEVSKKHVLGVNFKMPKEEKILFKKIEYTQKNIVNRSTKSCC